MAVDLLREIENNKFLLILMEEKEYLSKLEEIIKSVEKTKTKICYVCMSKPYTDVKEDLRGNEIDTGNFFFIDVLTSHYKTPEPVENCIFIAEPTDLTAIRIAIRKAVEEKQCSVILLDTVSTLLIYQENHSILKFTHHLLMEGKQENVKKLFIVLKGDTISLEENQRLVKDLEMFADKTIDLG
jgi:predicted PP-loop superfamily ATPase